MEVGKTIRDLRAGAGMSQEELAEKALVSRQTISNWENDKSYPDVQSLALIAELFGTSIDNLVKGDLPMISARIAEEDVKTFKRNTMLFVTLAAVSLVVMVVSFVQKNWLALGMSVFVYALALYFAILVERDKKKHDIRTYREIQAFLDGADIDEIRAQRAPEQAGIEILKKILAGGCAGVLIAFVVTSIMRLL